LNGYALVVMMSHAQTHTQVLFNQPVRHPEVNFLLIVVAVPFTGWMPFLSLNQYHQTMLQFSVLVVA